MPVGGHNLLEPAALGKPILTGPYTFNAEDIAPMFLEQHAAVRVPDANELALRLTAWIADPAAARASGERGRQLVLSNRGALERLLHLVDPLVSE